MKKSWLPILGFALEMGVRPIELLSEAAKEYGEIFGLVVAGNRMFFITDPHSHAVIIKPSKDLSWEEFHNGVLENFFGTSKKTLASQAIHDGEPLMRSFYSKYLFSDHGLHDLTTRMQRKLKSLVMETNAGSHSMQNFLNRFIFEASIVSLFNEDIGNDKSLYQEFCNFDKSLPLACAGVSVDYVRESRTGRDRLIAACIKHKQGVSEFIQRRWDHFLKITSEKDTASFQLAMLWASVGNTMPAVFWLMYYLLKHPEVKAEVLAEIASVGEAVGGEVSQQQLNQMVLLDACITETLRLSSGSFIMRFVRQPCEVTMASGRVYRFRAGDRLGIAPPLTHYDEDVFPDATHFKPARWLVGDSAEARMLSSVGKIPLSKGGVELSSTMAFLPFGGGTTICPGRRFARNEVKTLCYFLLTHFDLALDFYAEGSAPEFDGSRCGLGIFPPKKDVKITVVKR